MKINIEYRDEDERQKVLGFYTNIYGEEKTEEELQTLVEKHVTATLKAKLSPAIVRTKLKSNEGKNVATEVKAELASLFKED